MPTSLGAALFCATHATLPHIAVLHGDKILRVLSVTKQFDQLRTVQSTTIWKGAERLWLARIDRNVSVKALASALAAFVDSLGFVVYQAQTKASFVARLRLAPTRELRLTVGLDVVGRRVMQVFVC